MEFALVCIVFLRIVSANVRNIDCDFFVQNCIPCLADGECYCKSESDFVSLQCNKRIGERTGCFEIFDLESKDFNCKLQSMSVRKTTNDGIQFCRNYTRAEELLNIHAPQETALQLNSTLDWINNATVTLIIVIFIMFFGVVDIIIMGIVIAMLCLWSKKGKVVEENHYLEPRICHPRKHDDDDGI